MFRFQIGPRCSDKTGGGGQGEGTKREGEGEGGRGRGKVRSGYEIPDRNRALANRSPRPVHRAVTEN